MWDIAYTKWRPPALHHITPDYTTSMPWLRISTIKNQLTVSKICIESNMHIEYSVNHQYKPPQHSFTPKGTQHKTVNGMYAVSTLRSSDSEAQKSFLTLASWARAVPISDCRAAWRSADAFVSDARRLADSWRARRIPSSEKCCMLPMFCCSSSISSSAALSYHDAMPTSQRNSGIRNKDASSAASFYAILFQFLFGLHFASNHFCFYSSCSFSFDIKAGTKFANSRLMNEHCIICLPVLAVLL